MINKETRTKAIIRIGAPALMLLSGTPTAAQTEAQIGSNIQQGTPAEIPLKHLSQSDRTRATILAFSACVVARSRAAVERALALPIGDSAAAKAFSELMLPDCLRYGELKMSGSLVRGGLFNALYRKDFGRASSTPLSDKLIDYKQDVSDLTTQGSQTYIGLHDFADCVVRADPVNTRMVVLAVVGSSAEREPIPVCYPHYPVA